MIGVRDQTPEAGETPARVPRGVASEVLGNTATCSDERIMARRGGAREDAPALPGPGGVWRGEKGTGKARSGRRGGEGRFANPPVRGDRKLPSSRTCRPGRASSPPPPQGVKAAWRRAWSPEGGPNLSREGSVKAGSGCHVQGGTNGSGSRTARGRGCGARLGSGREESACGLVSKTTAIRPGRRVEGAVG